MSFEYVTLEEAIGRAGLRMTVGNRVPNPWSEAAKGFLHIKGIDWAAVRHDPSDEAQRRWTGHVSAPVALYESEAPRPGWAEILLLAERLAPAPALLPADPAARALVFGLAHEFCGEGGLGWSRRLQLTHAGLRNDGGFAEPAAGYLAEKYGYSPEAGAAARPRAAALVRMFADRLKAQRQAGSRYYVGESLSAADVYSATFLALFAPLPPNQCAMRDSTRAAFETRDADTQAALDPILFEHRDMIYAEYLALPLSL